VVIYLSLSYSMDIVIGGQDFKTDPRISAMRWTHTKRHRANEKAVQGAQERERHHHTLDIVIGPPVYNVGNSIPAIRWTHGWLSH